MNLRRWGTIPRDTRVYRYSPLKYRTRDCGGEEIFARDIAEYTHEEGKKIECACSSDSLTETRLKGRRAAEAPAGRKLLLCSACYCPFCLMRPAKGFPPGRTRPEFFGVPLALKLILGVGLSCSDGKPAADVLLDEWDALPVGVCRSMFSRSLAEDPVTRRGGALERMTSSPDAVFTLNSLGDFTLGSVVVCCAAPIRLTPINPTTNVSKNRIITSPYLDRQLGQLHGLCQTVPESHLILNPGKGEHLFNV